MKIALLFQGCAPEEHKPPSKKYFVGENWSFLDEYGIESALRSLTDSCDGIGGNSWNKCSVAGSGTQHAQQAMVSVVATPNYLITTHSLSRRALQQ